MINGQGYNKYNIWEYSAHVADLYRKRARKETDEMTCSSQAASILKMYAEEGDKLLDVGCGSGYFYHSLKKQNIPVEYYGIDASPTLVKIGQEELPHFGLPASHLMQIRIEDLNAEVDHIVCINVLSNIDNYHRPLERMLQSSKKTVILRESVHHNSSYNYIVDKYLDKPMKVHANTYPFDEWKSFIESYEFKVTHIIDEYTKGEPQNVIDFPHYWNFFLCERKI